MNFPFFILFLIKFFFIIFFLELSIPVQSKSQKDNLELGPATSGRRKSYKNRINSVSSISPLLFLKEEFKEIEKGQILHQHTNSADCSFDTIYSGQNDDNNHNYNYTYNEMNKSSIILTMTSGEKKLHDKYDDHLMQSISPSIKLNEVNDSDLQENKIDQIIFSLENKEKEEMFNLYHLQNQIQNMEMERNIVNRSIKIRRSLSDDDTYSCLSENDSIYQKSLVLLDEYNNLSGSFDDYDYADKSVANISNNDDNNSCHRTIKNHFKSSNSSLNNDKNDNYNNNDKNDNYNNNDKNDNYNNNDGSNNNNDGNNNNNNNNDSNVHDNQDLLRRKRTTIINNLTIVDNEKIYKGSPKKDDNSLNSGAK